MRRSARISLPARERGAALLILLAMIIPVLIYAVVAGLNRSAGELARARDQKTYAALAQAKEALIAYAMTYGDDPTHANLVPGYLPCPDLGSSTYEGQAALSCPQSGPSSLVSVMGRLPWRTLGLEALKDGSGECLWYAVSGTYKNNPNGVSTSTTASNMMNWDTNGQFRVMDADGSSYLAGSATDPSSNAVAVIFAPGAALSGQNRTPAAGTTSCGGNYTAAAYLETANGVNNSTLVSPSSPPLVTDFSSFIAGAGSDSFNDKLVYITRADIWNAVKRRSDFSKHLRALTRRAAECTALYGTYNGAGLSRKHLLWARAVSLSTTSIPSYAVNSQYNDTNNLKSGRLSYKVNSSRSDTNNDLDSYNSNDYLFSSSSYCVYTPEEQVWYDNWKDQLFYAVASEYRPSAWPATTSCGTCLTINGGGPYAALLIFAGEKLSGQSRNIATDKGAIANYLEGANTVANTGSSNYQAAAASATFNDIVYAIKGNLEVMCSDINGVMKSVPAAPAAPPGNPENYGGC